MIKFTRNSLILTLCTGYSDKKAFRACHSSKYSKTFDSLPEHLVHEWSRLRGTNILRTIFFLSQRKNNNIEKKTTSVQIPLIFCCWAYIFILYLGKENQFLQTNGPKIWCMKIALDQFTQSLLCTTAAPSKLSLVYLQTYCLLLTLLSKFLNCFVLKASVFKTK